MLLTILGLVVLIIMFFFLPRAALVLVVGAFLGGFWWLLFIPLTIIALVIDVIDIAEQLIKAVEA